MTGVRVIGAPELMAAFDATAKESKAGLRKSLRTAAVPVKERSQSLAVSEISHMGSGRWSRMRIGVGRSMVYVAPSSHRRDGSPRPNLAPLLLRSMEEALAENEAAVVGAIERMLDAVIAANF